MTWSHPSSLPARLPDDFFSALNAELAGVDHEHVASPGAAEEATPTEAAPMRVRLGDGAAPPVPAQPELHALRWQAFEHHLREATLFFTDEMGRVADWPDSAQQLLGLAPDEVLGQTLEWLDERTHAMPEVDVARATLWGQAEATGWRQRPDGVHWWCQTRITALYHPHTGDPLGYACWLQDRTSEQQLQQQLEILNQDLENRVRARTAQLQAIIQDLDTFSASVSHDLRAPLRHINSFMDVLLQDLAPKLDARQLKLMRTVLQSSQHMGQLIEGLLSFSRTGRSQLKWRPVSMGAIFTSSVNRVQHDPALKRDRDTLQLIFPSEWPEVHGDSMLLSQVWDNLLANAIKYSRKTEVARIEVRHRLDDQWGHVFEVQDNGVGFDAARADKLFGMFSRLHRAADFEGTGVGLALCRRIIERHGGQIWAHSAPGEGATFTFTLPDSGQPPQLEALVDVPPEPLT